MKIKFNYLIATAALMMHMSAYAGDQKIVVFSPTENTFPLVRNGYAASIIVDKNDYKGVLKAANDLKDDIYRVTQVTTQVKFDKEMIDTMPVIIGTLGKSDLINRLVANKKIDENQLHNKWEKFIITTVEQPFDGVKEALVIIGSDKRGTIYGIYELSSQMGVSPWYWWADIPVPSHKEIYVMKKSFTLGEPKVKYRGIFINDEAPALSGWTWEKHGGFNHKLYTRVFELILRLKGNYLWPAMWGNAFFVDDTLNGPLADEYGVVIGTSHHEPLLRAHAEWPKFGKGKWNYQVNDSVLRNFWRNSLMERKQFETILTIGLRGDGDEPMTEEANIALLEKIVSDQRKIIGEVYGKDPAKVPQLWALYKEVQDYYDKGMRVPDDVILLLCDDNWGNIRKLPLLTDKKHPGGYGIYYHFDYVGGPRNYKWLNTNQIERVWEQMHMAYEYGVNKIWIVNVGDIKPMEFPIEFFLELAWDPEKWTADNVHLYYSYWANKYFTPALEPYVSTGLKLYTKFNARRKPELLNHKTYSIINYQEAEKVVDEYNNLYIQTKLVYDTLQPQWKDAFYQLILHPIEACSNLYNMYFAVAKNYQYAEQQRSATNAMSDKVKQFFRRDAEITDFYNHKLANGKWNHFMDQTHIGYTSWQQPDSNIMPVVKNIQVPQKSEMGLWVEGSSAFYPAQAILKLPELNNLQQSSTFFEIFNRGSIPFGFEIKTSARFIKISKLKGKIEKEERFWVSVDWDKAKEEKTIEKIFVKALGKTVTIDLPIVKYNADEIKQMTGFVESNGYIAIEAKNYSNAYDAYHYQWKNIDNLGRTSSAMVVKPSTFQNLTLDSLVPKLEYQIYTFDTGRVALQIYFSPTLAFNENIGLSYAVAIDDEKPQIINMHKHVDNKTWEKMVANNIHILTTYHHIKNKGMHTIKFWALDGGIVLQRIIVDFGGVKESYLGPPESFRK